MPRNECGAVLRVSLVAALVVSCAVSRADTIVVSSEADSGVGTLRAAIEQANGSFGGDTITFAANVTRIRPLTNLPAITDTTGGVTIDGDLAVVLDGSLGVEVGLQDSSAANTISGMIVVNFFSAGIYLLNSEDSVVRGCWIGTDGVSASVGNGSGIIFVGQCVNNRIGGPNPEDRNVISGNVSTGVAYSSNLTTGNIIEGNYIGTDVTGAFALGSGGDGVFGLDASNNTIRNNVISANGRHGILVGGGATSGNRIEGNIVGLNAAGTAALPNGAFGIVISSPGNFVGGTAPGAGNVVSGNSVSGIYLSNAANTEVQGNIIGLGANGVTPLGNGGHGILVENSDGVMIGGTVAGAGNTITGNAQAGIAVTAESDDVVIRGNRIGVTVAGLAPATPQLKGVFISDSVGTAIGGATPASGNVIAYHSEQGVQGAPPDVSGVTVRRNSIHSNLLKGIDWASGINPGATVPVITGIDPIAGTSAALNIIEIFADSADEGRILVDTVQATPGGTFGSGVSLGAYKGLNLTATATTTSGSTSEFSAPVLIDLPYHSADLNTDDQIDLSEVLRVIQFYNATGFGCEAGTEDGYNPNSPDTGCAPHASDYNPKDWEISLPELLRLIQLFNVGAYHSCLGEVPATEDGYCPGIA